MDKETIIQLYEKFKTLKIAVIGDFVLDQYFVIDPALNEPSLETEHLAYQVIGTRKYPGACGTVTNNLSALGIGEIYGVSFIGNDGFGYDLRKELEKRNIRMDYFIDTDEMITPSYIKPMMLEEGKESESNRLDVKNFTNTPKALEKQILDCLGEVFEKMDAVIILDQMVENNCGVITDGVRKKLIALGKKYKDTVVFADSRSKIQQFENMSIKCNNFEICNAFYPNGQQQPDMDRVKECGQRMANQNQRPVFVTLGKHGIIAFDDTQKTHVPTVDVPPKPYDICGAGDSVSAGIVSVMAAGANQKQAAFFGNLIASITIRKIGQTGTASYDEVMETYDGYFKDVQWQELD